MEQVRYIHVKLIHAGTVRGTAELEPYRYSAYSVVMGKVNRERQEAGEEGVHMAANPERGDE